MYEVRLNVPPTVNLMFTRKKLYFQRILSPTCINFLVLHAKRDRKAIGDISKLL